MSIPVTDNLHADIYLVQGEIVGRFDLIDDRSRVFVLVTEKGTGSAAKDAAFHFRAKLPRPDQKRIRIKGTIDV